MTKIADALAVLIRYDPAGEVNVGHDALYAGGQGAHPDRMTPEDRRAIKRLRWDWDDELDTWRTFV